MNYLRVLILLGLTPQICTIPLVADIKVPPIFGDHMVLQQGMILPVWGVADPGENVVVTVGNETGTATAGTDGKWMVKLPPLPAGVTPVTLNLQGKNRLQFQDVLIGEVWLCSGQSNMVFGLGASVNGAEETQKADHPLLRLFVVPHNLSMTPSFGGLKADPRYAMQAHWFVCTPQTVANVSNWKGFSAVGYYFGREIQKATGEPVGLIASAWSGSPAQGWTSLSGLEKEPLLQHYTDEANLIRANYPKASADYPAQLAAYQAAMAKWTHDVDTPYKESLKKWNDAVAQASAGGQKPPQKPPAPSSAPPAPTAPDGGSNAPANLFNGMIAPLIPFGLKGVIWYQGESNAGYEGEGDNPAPAEEYETLFGRLITDWREKWGQGNFPFLYVQLPNLRLLSLSALSKNPNFRAEKIPVDSGLVQVREAQLKTLALPNTGMAVTIDVGDPRNFHPPDKLDVGLRLALAAKHVAYGQNVVYSGPIYDKMQIEGNSIRLSFTQIGSGLKIGTAPWIPPGSTPPPDSTLVGFEIAGEDKKWFTGSARIDRDTVIVSSSQVPSPVAVRYAWASQPPQGCNLYNKEELPASPFRTDNWDDFPSKPSLSPMLDATPPSASK